MANILVRNSPTNLLAYSRSVTLRPVEASDEAFLYQLYATVQMDDRAMRNWNEAQWESFLRSQFKAQLAHFRIFFSQADHRLILLDGQPIGRTYVNRTADEIRLLDISLLPAYRGTGIGTILLGALQDEAERTGRPVRLHVKSPRVRGWYERLGFRETGRTGTYISMEWRPTGRC